MKTQILKPAMRIIFFSLIVLCTQNVKTFAQTTPPKLPRIKVDGEYYRYFMGWGESTNKNVAYRQAMTSTFKNLGPSISAHVRTFDFSTTSITDETKELVLNEIELNSNMIINGFIPDEGVFKEVQNGGVLKYHCEVRSYIEEAKFKEYLVNVISQMGVVNNAQKEELRKLIMKEFSPEDEESDQ